MNDPFAESFLPEEQIITWRKAIEGYALKCLIVFLILGILLMFALSIWFGIEHAS